jgi:hypothetical protein
MIPPRTRPRFEVWPENETEICEGAASNRQSRHSLRRWLLVLVDSDAQGKGEHRHVNVLAMLGKLYLQKTGYAACTDSVHNLTPSDSALIAPLRRPWTKSATALAERTTHKITRFCCYRISHQGGGGGGRGAVGGGGVLYNNNKQQKGPLSVFGSWELVFRTSLLAGKQSRIIAMAPLTGHMGV